MTEIATSLARSRAAYRAIYLASPLKFCTSLSPFDQSFPVYYIGAWQKDPYAYHKWKRRNFMRVKRGRYTYTEGPLVGWRGLDYPDPGLVGPTDLAAVARQASAGGLDSIVFWQRLSERVRVLRDVMSVGHLVDVVDALVAVKFRHVDLMKLMSRELIDDVDKLDLREVAAVANAYAHFNCHSRNLLDAMTKHVGALLRGVQNAQARLDASEIQAIGVFAKALKALNFGDDDVRHALRDVFVAHMAEMRLTEVVPMLEYLHSRGQPLALPQECWSSCTSKVYSQSLDLLGRLLNIAAEMNISDMPLRAEIALEAISQLQSGTILREIQPGMGLPAKSSSVLPLCSGSGFAPLPAFAKPPTPRQLSFATPALQLESVPPKKTTPIEFAGYQLELPEEEATTATELDFQLEEPSALFEEKTIKDNALQTESQSARWYNASTRRPFGVTGSKRPSGYGSYSADVISRRNRRGAHVASILDAFSKLWAKTDAVDIPYSELQCVQVAAPVVMSTASGLSASHLAGCAEAYSRLADAASKQPPPSSETQTAGRRSEAAEEEEPALPTTLRRDVAEEAIQVIVREGVRKLSNFGIPNLRRLHCAAQSVSLQDPYLERAQHRFFPKAYRNELRDGRPTTEESQPE